MTLTLLIACMHEKDTSIIERSNVQTDVVVVNQCDHDSIKEFDFVNKKGQTCHAKFICTTERGLSRSRNMAIRNAWGDVCLICDDDEYMEDDYEYTILSAYQAHSNSIVNTFSLIRKDCDRKYPAKSKRLGFIDTLHTNSLQISFDRQIVLDNKITFDEMMGSGTGNGGGEENHFMIDCYKTGGPMYYTPINIATVLPGESQYFHGYDKKWCTNFGWSSRRLLGPFLGALYILHFAVKNHDKYNEYVTIVQMLTSAFKGFLENRTAEVIKKAYGGGKKLIYIPLYSHVEPLTMAA